MTNPPTGTDAPEAVMSLVMKLLALAADESTSQHERDLAEARAERIMAKHLIDRFEAQQHLSKTDQAKARKPIQEDWEVATDEHEAQGVDDQHEFRYAIIHMMEYTLEHCNIKINPNYKYSKGCNSRIYQIVGFREDIMYAERIWFNIFKTFVNNVNPKWLLSKSIEENAYTFASAGVSWKDQVLLAEAAEDTRLEWPWREYGQPIDPGNVPWGKSIHKLKRACKKYCDNNGLAYPYAGGTKLRIATRNSFARSYRATIQQRLDKIRQEAQMTAEMPRS